MTERPSAPALGTSSSITFLEGRFFNKSIIIEGETIRIKSNNEYITTLQLISLRTKQVLLALSYHTYDGGWRQWTFPPTTKHQGRVQFRALDRNQGVVVQSDEFRIRKQSHDGFQDKLFMNTPVLGRVSELVRSDPEVLNPSSSSSSVGDGVMFVDLTNDGDLLEQTVQETPPTSSPKQERGVKRPPVATTEEPQEGQPTVKKMKEPSSQKPLPSLTGTLSNGIFYVLVNGRVESELPPGMDGSSLCLSLRSIHQPVNHKVSYSAFMENNGKWSAFLTLTHACYDNAGTRGKQRMIRFQISDTNTDKVLFESDVVFLRKSVPVERIGMAFDLDKRAQFAPFQEGNAQVVVPRGAQQNHMPPPVTPPRVNPISQNISNMSLILEMLSQTAQTNMSQIRQPQIHPIQNPQLTIIPQNRSPGQQTPPRQVTPTQHSTPQQVRPQHQVRPPTIDLTSIDDQISITTDTELLPLPRFPWL